MADPKKDTQGSIPTRALSGAMQGLRDEAAASTLGLGLLPLMPMIRQRAFEGHHVPKEFSTVTKSELGDLTLRLLEKAKRGTPLEEGGRDIILDVVENRPGHAEFIRELKRPPGVSSGKNLRDIIRLSLGVAPETVAHEVGHATTGGKAGRVIRALGMRARHPLVAAAPSALAMSGVLGDGETPTYAKAAPWLGGGALAAILGEETRANLRGAKALKELGYAMPLKKRLKMFLPTATYLGKAGIMVGAPLGILRGLDYYNKLQREGRPMAARDLLRASPQALASLPSKGELRKKWGPALGKKK